MIVGMPDTRWEQLASVSCTNNRLSRIRVTVNSLCLAVTAEGTGCEMPPVFLLRASDSCEEQHVPSRQLGQEVQGSNLGTARIILLANRIGMFRLSSGFHFSSIFFSFLLGDYSIFLGIFLIFSEFFGFPLGFKIFLEILAFSIGFSLFFGIFRFCLDFHFPRVFRSPDMSHVDITAISPMQPNFLILPFQVFCLH